MKKRFVQIVYVTLLFVVTAVLSLSMTSCDEGGIDSQAPAGVRVGISAQPSYDVTASAAQVKFSVTSNTPWAITSDQSWCTVTPVSSSVSALVHEVTVEVLQNPDMKPRTAILTISGDGVEAQKVTIEQDARAELNVAMFETNSIVPRAGEIRELTVFSNKAWRITSDKSWLTFDITEGEGSDDVYRIKATFAENTGNMRKAVVTIKTNTVDSVYTVTQDGNLLEVANVNDTTYNGSLQVKTYTVNSNLEWKVEVDPKYSWIHITSPVTGNGNGEVEVKVDNYYKFTEEARIGAIKISPVTPVVGVENINIAIHQNAGFTKNMNGNGKITYNADGSATFETDNSQARMQVAGRFAKGTAEWKFSAFDMGTDGTFYMQGDGQDGTSPTSANFIMWFGPKNHQMSNCGGGFGWEPAAEFDITNVDFSNIQKIKLVIDDDPANSGKLAFDIYVNDQLIWHKPNKGNPYVTEKGISFYWGFNGGGSASFTVDSYTFTPAE